MRNLTFGAYGKANSLVDYVQFTLVNEFPPVCTPTYSVKAREFKGNMP
ncbi:MAG: hypothetical protein AAF694_08085 [Bacteroidota bacterium]